VDGPSRVIDTAPFQEGAMASCFKIWTVLPHKPLEKLTENLWRVEGTMPDGKTRRVMVVAKRKDGALVIHNAIALEEALMTELEAFGAPRYLVVPNGFHRQDAFIWKDRYKDMTVLAPTKGMGRVRKVVAVDGSLADYPPDDDVRLGHLVGTGEREGLLEVRSKDGITVVFNDALANMPKLKGLPAFLMGPTGKFSIPRVSRLLLVRDKRAFSAELRRLAGDDLKRVIVSHGRMVSEGAAGVLQTVANELD
jgi:hypothetical protein